MDTLSVIVINHNRKDLLMRCLSSAGRQVGKAGEIIVVDNASTDGSVEAVKSVFKDARLICNKKNLFFSAACNQGIDAARGGFILCMNNDVVLGEDFISRALSPFRRDKRIGMVTGKILRMDGRTIDSTGLFPARNRKAVERGYNRTDRGQFDAPGYVFGVSGACALYRRSMLEDIKDEYGYFDERFGMYYEDLDLCWRAHKRGWKAFYNPFAVAYHERAGTATGGGASAPRGAIFPLLDPELRRMYIRNRRLCMKKNDTILWHLLCLPFILSYEFKLKLYGLLANRK